MTAPYSGLTWDHPRGYDALAAAAERVNAGRETPLIRWAKQPLEGFESAPVGELAAAHDLLVLDHPHIGEAAALDCLIPLEGLYSQEQISAWEAGTIGPALRSYVWQGRTYALPLDVATQVMARRPDRIAIAPDTWEEVLALAETQPVGLSIAGPHALLTLFSIAACLGALPGGHDLLEDAAALEALCMLHRLYRLAPAETHGLNPIELLEAMAHGDNIALVPLIFGYVTYSAPNLAPHPLAFSEAPRMAGGPMRGSVLGGTGIGFTKRAEPSPELLEHVASLMEESTQRRFIPAHGGQPSARTAWADPTVNAEWGNFYKNTMATAEAALIRPRFDGYIAFQTGASALLREALAQAAPEATTLAALRHAWRRSRESARGDLDDLPRGQV